MNIRQAISDKKTIGASIRNPASWAPWLAMMAAIFGLPLSDTERALYQSCTGRMSLPTTPFQFVWLCIGRRGGKSFAMAVLAVYLGLFKDWKRFLSPGERAVVLLIAADVPQAKILFRYIVGLLKPKLLAAEIDRTTASEVELKNGVSIEVCACSYRSVRGRSVAVALLDEIAFWPREDSASPDTETFNAIRAAQATFGSEAMVVASSSPYSRSGILWDAFRKFHGREDASNIFWRADTRTMNPTVEQSFIDAEYERDPTSADAEYGANFRSDIAEFVSLAVLEACTLNGVHEIAPLPVHTYVAFVDPSGGSSDSMTLAIAHREPDSSLVVDAVREIQPPFAPETAVEDFCRTLASYKVRTVYGDRYAGEWPREQFAKRNVAYRPSDLPKSDIYRDVLPLLNNHRVKLLDNRRLISQLHGLERRTSRAGKDSIDHGPGRHDDVANAVCGSLLKASEWQPPMKWAAPISIERERSNINYQDIPASEYENPAAPSRPEYRLAGGPVVHWSPPGGWTNSSGWRK